MKRLASIIPVILILSVAPAIMYPLWSNPVSAGEDDVVFYYPLRKLAGTALASGIFPLENPLEACGGALAADPQAALLNPATWLFAAMDAKIAYSISIFLAFQLAGLGTYFYTRRLGLSRPASTFAAIAFMLSGFMVGHRVHLSMIHSAAMLPWGLLCIELLRNKNWGQAGLALPARTSKKSSGDSNSCSTLDRPYLAIGLMVPVIFYAISAGSWPTLINISIVWFAYLLLRGRPIVKSAALLAWSMLTACLIASPQILATYELMQQVTRQKLGFVIFGENSFFPPASVLAFFPMLLGNRNPNFFSQPWWGPWHQCEMLGYVGLATLVLAISAVICLYRRNKKQSAQSGPADCPDLGQYRQYQNLVRTWTFLAVGGGIWMLGYYLPTYRLLHMVPVLNVVRCPARMVLVVDLALACLSAIAIHICSQGHDELRQKLIKTVKRGAMIALPLAMLLTLLAVAGVAFGVQMQDFWQFFVGSQADAQAAMRIANPAIYIPLILCAVTACVIWFWAARPANRSAILVAVLILDLFFVARFVDIPPASKIVPDPDVSPAAAWLKAHDPAGVSAPGLAQADGQPTYRIWGMSQEYFRRPAELLLPKTCQALGFASINSYGPFQSPRHAQTLGFDITGYNRDWPNLVRRNDAISLYGVKYLIAADRQFRDVIESVKIAPQQLETGLNLLQPGAWQLYHARQDESAQDDMPAGSDMPVLTLGTQFMFLPSKAMQKVSVQAGQVYRISLDARGPMGGAAFTLRAEVAGLYSQAKLHWDRTGLSIRGDEITATWRRFDYYFQAPAQVSDSYWFILQTVSERPIEVRDVELCESHWPVPVVEQGDGQAGKAVYELKATLPALDPGDEPVAIYENTLCNGQAVVNTPGSDDPADQAGLARVVVTQAPPDIALHSTAGPWRIGGILAGVWGGAYVMVLAWGLLAAGRRQPGQARRN
jgi:hypothetical protein